MTQLADMADDGAMADGEQETRRVTEQLGEVSERLNARKQALKVGTELLLCRGPYNNINMLVR